MDTFAQNFLRGLEMGRQKKRQEDDDLRDDEERKLRIETLRHQQKRLDLEGKYKAFERQRTAAEGESKQLEGQPLAKLLQTQFVQPGQETPSNAVTAMNEAGLPALATQQRRQVQIPGSEEFGIPGRTDTPQSFEELLGQQRATKMAQQGLVNVAPGGAVYDPVSEEVEFRNPPRETRQPSEPQKTMEQQLLEAETSGNAQQAAAIRRVMNARDANMSGKPNEEGGKRKRLSEAVIANPALWDELGASDKADIAADLAAQGFNGFGRRMSDGAIKQLSETRGAIEGLRDLRKTLQENEQFIGPLAGLQALNPYSEGRKAQAQIDLVRQRVGKALEGGVLRKEDEEKYKKILATLRDEPSTAIFKVDNLLTTLERDLELFTDEQRNAGRRVGAQSPQGQGGSEFNWVDGKLVPVTR